jgi:hypothetical protein
MTTMLDIGEDLAKKALRIILKNAGAGLYDHEILMLCKTLTHGDAEDNARAWLALMPPESGRVVGPLRHALGESTLLDRPGIALILLGIKAVMDAKGSITKEDADRLMQTFGVTDAAQREAVWTTVAGAGVKSGLYDFILDALPIIGEIGGAFVGSRAGARGAVAGTMTGRFIGQEVRGYLDTK